MQIGIRRQLGALLRQAKESCIPPTFEQLAIAIADVNRDSGGRIDRRKLKKIADSGDGKLSLSFLELEALNKFLVLKGIGLAAVFERPSLLSHLAESGDVTFIIGTTPFKSVSGVSRWDMRAMANLLGGCGRYSPQIHFTIEESYFHPAESFQTGRNGSLPFRDEQWFAALQHARPVSIASIGSMQAAHSTEWLLSQMFCVHPFQPNHGKSLPFSFSWPAHRLRGFASSFSIPGKPLKKGAMAIRLEDRTIAVDTLAEEWDDYGIVAAQCRRPRAIVAVLSGLGGPSTFVASRLVDKMITDLPEGVGDQPGPVVWSAVKARVRRNPRLDGDQREVISSELYLSPRTWDAAQATGKRY
jgi:hypothetical protein